jgi:hypothetical protein
MVGARGRPRVRHAAPAHPLLPAAARSAKGDFERYRALSDASELDGELAGDLGPLILNRGETNPCDPVQVVEICGAGHRFNRTYACARRRCPGKACRRHALQERTKLLKPLMLEGFPGAWGVVVLTYPPEARAAVRQNKLLRRSRRGALLLVEDWVLQCNGLSSRDGWRLGICSIEHPEGDQKPGEWLPHHNVLFPQTAIHADGRRRTLRFFLDKEHLAKLRSWWRWWLESVVVGHQLPREANVFYEFRNDTKKKKHCARYFARTFPTWSCRGQRLTWFGAFGCRIVNELPEMKLLTKPPPVNESGWCNVCGSEVVKRDFSPSPCIPARYRAVTGGCSP